VLFVELGLTTGVGCEVGGFDPSDVFVEVVLFMGAGFAEDVAPLPEDFVVSLTETGLVGDGTEAEGGCGEFFGRLISFLGLCLDL